MFLGSRGRFDEALQQMRRAEQLDPLSLVVASGIGRILHFAGRFDEAIAQFRHVIEMDPTFSRVWFDLGLTLTAMGAYDEAFQGLKKAGNQPFALVLTSVGLALAGTATAPVRRLAGSRSTARAARSGMTIWQWSMPRSGTPSGPASSSSAHATSVSRRSPMPP